MILREITVRGVKCFRDECAVGRFGDGLNMIFGPNEAGKSTLIEATARALFDGYTVTGDAIESMRPWGTSLAPEVALEFEARDGQWRLEKRLLSGASCSLRRMEGGGWSLIHERDAADSFVRELLHGEAPGRGASDLRHWGLARTLWCLSDPCMIGRDDGVCVVPSDVAAEIRSVLGEGTVATAVDSVWEVLDARYGDFFTARRGDPKTNSQLVTLSGETERLELQRVEVEAQLREVEDAATRLDALQGEIADLRLERERLQEQVAAYRAEAEAVQELQHQIDSAKKELEQAESSHDAIAKDLKRFTEAREQADLARAQLRESEDALENLDAELRAAQQLAAEAETDHAEAQNARKGASEQVERGRKVESALRLTQERQSLEELLAGIVGLREQCERSEARLREMACPEAGEIERAEALERDVQRLQAQLEAAGLNVTIEARREQELALTGGEEDLRKRVSAGDEIAYAAGAALEIELPDVARISVRSGAKEPAQLSAELDATRAKLRGLLAAYAMEGAAGLRDLQRARERAREDHERLAEQMLTAAAPYDGPDEVRERQAEVRVELAKCLNELTLAEGDLPALERPNLERLDQQFRAAQAREDEAQAILDRRRKHAEELSKKRSDLRDNQSTSEGTLQGSETTMAHLLERHGCADEEALEASVAAAEATVAELAEGLDEQRQRLPSPEADPRLLAETAEEALRQAAGREIELAGQRGDNEGIIDRARTEGRYERLTRIEEELAGARRKLHETWREAQAIKLLRSIIESRRAEVSRGALPGLTEQVMIMFRQVTGRDRSLRMDEEMAVSDVIENGIEHKPSALSAGTREQLDLVTRLALGQSYAKAAGRTMMVLDDALLYTDPRRHDRIKQLLQRAGDLLQVFILTSHPERYRGIVPTECQFDLEAIRSHQR